MISKTRKNNHAINAFRINRNHYGFLASMTAMGSLRSYDGCCNENNTLKYNFSLGRVFLRLFHVCHVIQNRRSALLFVWYKSFPRSGREWKIHRCGLALFHISRCHLADCVKNCTKKRAARAARLFILIQPIKPLICGVVVVVAVVISETP